MTRPRIALVNAAHEADGTRRNFRRELDASLVEFPVVSGQYPDTFDVDGVVVTGSKSSVYDDAEWIDATKAWVGEAIDRGLPTLGVCFGHQLVADVLGGDVADMGEYELGYRTVEQSGESRLLDGIDREFTVFTTHSDTVAGVPAGAELLAENDYGVQAFRDGNAFGVQFHPEYDLATAERVTRRKDLPDERIEAVLEGVTDGNYDAACQAKLVFDNFVEYVRETTESDGSAGATAADD